jgi:hypothetical protein
MKLNDEWFWEKILKCKLKFGGYEIIWEINWKKWKNQKCFRDLWLVL